MSNHPLLRQAFILTILLVDLDSARPMRARMHSRLVPISSSFSSFDLSIASVTRESTIPRLAEVNGGSDSRRDRHSAGVLARLATATAAWRLAGRYSVSTRRRADARHRASAAFFTLGSQSWSRNSASQRMQHKHAKSGGGMERAVSMRWH